MQVKYSANTYYLVRHGEAENNVLGVLNATSRKEYALTERGRKQIEELGVFLRSKPLDFIIASPLLRTRETAMILASALGIPVSTDMRLCEPQFGPFEGDRIQTFLDFMKNHGGRTVGDTELHVEGYIDIRERVQSFLHTLNQNFQKQHVVIVSHMDTLQELYAELIGEPVGAEQGVGGWYPKQGSCRLVNAAGAKELFSSQER